MALVGIVNLADRLFNESQSQAQADKTSSPVQPSAQTGPDSQESANLPNPDQFTSSSQSSAADATAQAAGLFSVNTFSMFTAAANFLLRAPSSALANAGVQPNGAARSQGNASARSSAEAPSGVAGAGSASAASTLGSAATPTGAASSQRQALNSALAALGLPRDDTASIERIATLLQDFNPATYTDLLHQLQALAPNQTSQAGTPQSAAAAQAATPAANPNIAAPLNADSPAGALPKETSASRGEFQVEELVIRFAGANTTQITSPALKKNATNATTHATTQGNPFNLRLKEVTLTLKNRRGQAATVVAPQSVRASSAANDAISKADNSGLGYTLAIRAKAVSA